MGLMDSFMKGLMNVAENIDKQAGLSGENSLGSVAQKAKQVYDQTVDNAPENTAQSPEGTVQNQSSQPLTAKTADPVQISGDYQTAEGNGISFEVPAEFEEFDAGALEIQLSYMYPDDISSPSIFIQEPGGGLPGVKTPVSIGNMEYGSGDWIVWKGSKMKYYGFKDGSGNEKLLIATASDDKSVNAMMEQALDHAAKTLNIGTV